MNIETFQQALAVTKQIISNGTGLTKRCFYLKSIIIPARRSRPLCRGAFYVLSTKELLILHVEWQNE